MYESYVIYIYYAITCIMTYLLYSTLIKSIISFLSKNFLQNNFQHKNTLKYVKNIQVLTFGRRIDVILNRRELAETESTMLLVMMIIMTRVMGLRGRRGLPHATHQAEGTADTSAVGGGARRHRPTALKHPEEPGCNVRFSHALVPRREKPSLRSFPALPAVHPSSKNLVSNSRTQIDG